MSIEDESLQFSPAMAFSGEHSLLECKRTGAFNAFHIVSNSEGEAKWVGTFSLNPAFDEVTRRRFEDLFTMAPVLWAILATLAKTHDAMDAHSEVMKATTALWQAGGVFPFSDKLGVIQSLNSRALAKLPLFDEED